MAKAKLGINNLLLYLINHENLTKTERLEILTSLEKATKVKDDKWIKFRYYLVEQPEISDSTKEQIFYYFIGVFGAPKDIKQELFLHLIEKFDFRVNEKDTLNMIFSDSSRVSDFDKERMVKFISELDEIFNFEKKEICKIIRGEASVSDERKNYFINLFKTEDINASIEERIELFSSIEKLVTRYKGSAMLNGEIRRYIKRIYNLPDENIEKIIPLFFVNNFKEFDGPYSDFFSKEHYGRYHDNLKPDHSASASASSSLRSPEAVQYAGDDKYLSPDTARMFSKPTHARLNVTKTIESGIATHSSIQEDKKAFSSEAAEDHSTAIEETQRSPSLTHENPMFYNLEPIGEA
jgi:hypothetical protein